MGRVNSVFRTGKEVFPSAFGRFRTVFDLLKFAKDPVELMGRAVCAKQANECLQLQYVSQFGTAFNWVGKLFDLPKFQEHVWAGYAKTVSGFTGLPKRKSLGIPGPMMRYLIQLLPEYDMSYYLFVAFCMLYLGRAKECWALLKSQVKIETSAMNQRMVRIELKRKKRYEGLHVPDEIILVETCNDALSPVKIVEHLLKVHDGKFLAPTGGNTKSEAKDRFYQEFHSFMDFFIRKAAEEHQWNGNKLKMRWHNFRATLVGILDKFPEISLSRTKLQMCHSLESKATK